MVGCSRNARMSSEEPQNRQFESVGEAIRALLPRIDEDLASQDMPPSHRVTAAAVTFVEKFVIDTSGGKDDFWVKPWFKAIYTEVMEWYRERYGTALTHNPGGI